MRIKAFISFILLTVMVFSCTPVRKSYNNPEGPRFVGMFAKEPIDFDGEVKVVTYNVKLGKNIEQTIHELDNVPELKDADVIFMQEMERVFGDAGFERATKGIGATQQIDPLGLIKFEFDHIFIRGFEVMSVGKVKEAKASDHIPVWTVLRIKNYLFFTKADPLNCRCCAPVGMVRITL